MTPEQIAEARRLANAATPAPWPKDFGRCDSTPEGCMAIGPLVTRDDECAEEQQAQADHDFLAASITLVPQLLDALETAKHERDKAKTECKRLCALFEHNSDYGMRADLSVVDAWIKTAEKERDTARAQVATLAEALRFYANENAWDGDHADSLHLAGDLGECARIALQEAGVIE